MCGAPKRLLREHGFTREAASLTNMNALPLLVLALVIAPVAAVAANAPLTESASDEPMCLEVNPFAFPPVYFVPCRSSAASP